MVELDDEMLLDDDNLLSPKEQNSPAQQSAGSVPQAENLLDELNYTETQPNMNGFFADADDQSCTVKVAVRVRPHVGRELRDLERKSCVTTQQILNKISIGEKMFQFDRVFDQDSQQQELFETCTKNLVLGCFSGYNATVIAYGQTGSGKTHTMGTGSTIGLSFEQIGIVPRVFDFIFSEIENRKKQSDFNQYGVKVQFLEIYGDDLHDLLDVGVIDKVTGKSNKNLMVREEKNGTIKIDNLKAELVNGQKECLQLLNKGIQNRVTSATLMNEESSRSHAIFTVTIEQKIVKVINPENEQEEFGAQEKQPETSEENISAKFHFVDLAGSERIKKTGASGKQQKEGININRGLLSLGNVISALTDEKKAKAGTAFIPYRDSKLTRILQDSLGGNSRTTMIACVSPAESNYEETLGAIKYASRARNIQNKPIVNRDPNSVLIENLRNQVNELQTEIGEYQGILKENNIPMPEGFTEIIKAKSQEKSEQQTRRTSILGAQMPGLPKILNTEKSRDSISSQGPLLSSRLGGGGADMKEVRELKLRLAKKEAELKDANRQLGELKQGRQSKHSENESLQRERDALVIQNETLLSQLEANNVKAPSATAQAAPTIGGKRTQTLIDEYKAKIAKFQQESEKKTAEILAKSKKIAELQSQVKRDEATMKRTVDENTKMKKEIFNFKKQSSPRNKSLVSPRLKGSGAGLSPRFSAGMNAAMRQASPRSKKSESRKQAQNDLLNVDDLNEQLMQKLSSEFEDVFATEEPLLVVDNEQTAEEEANERDENEKHMKEMSQATSVEEKEKFLKALQNKSEHIKSVMGDFLKNTWAQKIQQFEHEKSKTTIEHKKKIQASQQNNDSAEMKKLTADFKKKMDELNKQINEQQRAKQKKEDQIKKTIAQQDARIKIMESELAKQKKANEQLEIQKKYGEERYSKMRVQTGKDITNYKKTVADKEKTVYSLKNELKKTDAIVNQKMNELKALQTKARDEKLKRIQEEEKEQDAKGVDVEAIKDWIHMSTEQLLKQQELKEYLKKLYSQKEEIEDEMLTEGDRLTELIVLKERLEDESNELNSCIADGKEYDQVRLIEVEQELEDVDLESNSITQTLDQIDEHLDYVNNQIAQLNTQIKTFDMDAIQPPRFKGLSNVDMARQTLRTFFMVLLDINVYKKELEAKCIEQDEQVLLLQGQVAVLKENSNLTEAQQRQVMKRQHEIRNLVTKMGSSIDEIDNRDAEMLHLSQAEQQQLTKMSLSKIVSNLRAKIKEAEVKNQSLSARLDTVMKEKDQFKLKYNQLQKEQKLRGGRIPSESTMSFTKASGHSAVQSRINTGIKSSGIDHGDQRQGEVFTGFATKNSARVRATQPGNMHDPGYGRKLSFKERRNQMKAYKVTEGAEPAAKPRQISNLHDRRRANATGNNSAAKDKQARDIAELEKEAKSSFENSGDAGEKKAARKNQLLGADEKGVTPGSYLTSPSQPETVHEVDETAEEEKLEEDAQIIIEETDDILSEQRQPTSRTFLEGSDVSSHSDRELNWNFEDVTGLPVDDGQEVIGADSIDNRLFVMFDDLTLTEVNLSTKEVVREVQIYTLVEEDVIAGDDKATAFDMFKDLNMIAISTSKGVHLFDYEEDMSHVTTIKVQNVSYLTFIDVYIVMLVESEDSSQATLLCYQIDGEEPEGSITINQFLGQKVRIAQGDQAVVYATGAQLGRITVPDMELEYQEDAGHNIINFATTDTCIFTTGDDESIRAFDADTGMQLIEPMQDMECDSLACQGYHLVARCGGGQAMFVFKYMDGDEELCEEDFIESEKVFGDPAEQKKFLMKGNLNATLDKIEYRLILTAVQTEQGLLLKMLKNKSPS